MSLGVDQIIRDYEDSYNCSIKTKEDRTAYLEAKQVKALQSIAIALQQIATVLRVNK